MEFFNQKEFEPIKKIITDSRKIIRNAINTHFKETLHDDKRRVQEINFILDIIKMATRKWNTDILFELEIHNGLIFNDLMRHIEKISSRTLSNSLKQLQRMGLVTRTVQNTRPVSVFYELSDKGKGLVELSMIILYFLKKDEIDNTSSGPITE